MLVLLLPALFGVGVKNTFGFLEYLTDKVKIEIFLKDEITPQETLALYRKLLHYRGIKRITYLSKEAALKKLKERAELGCFLEALSQNPCPASYQLWISPALLFLPQFDELTQKLTLEKGVEEIASGGRAFDRLRTLLKLVSFLFTGIAVLVFFIIVAVITDTLRNYLLTTPKLKKKLLLLDSLLLGFLGSSLALGVAFLLWQKVLSEFSTLPLKFLSAQECGWFIGASSGIFLFVSLFFSPKKSFNEES
jgi:cell division transport system permease protein